VHRTASKR